MALRDEIGNGLPAEMITGVPSSRISMLPVVSLSVRKSIFLRRNHDR
ncbi:MAG: hypothetical protein V3T64_04905 [Myxococcota bacterium]